MSNAHYYRYEAELAGAIREANPLTVRGALVGMLRHCPPDLVRNLHGRLRDFAEPGTDFRAKLDALKEGR
jgi:hypothetical protein